VGAAGRRENKRGWTNRDQFRNTQDAGSKSRSILSPAGGGVAAPNGFSTPHWDTVPSPLNGLWCASLRDHYFVTTGARREVDLTQFTPRKSTLIDHLLFIRRRDLSDRIP